MRAPLRVLSLLSLLVATSARAEADWFASLYTGDGIELRADERVFTLFALMNAMGYDAGPIARQHPLPRYELHPVRQRVRLALLGADPEVRKAAETFFDAHPQPLRQYLAYSLNAAPPPFGAGPKGREFGELKGLEQLLAKVHSQWKLGELMATVQADYRKALKSYLVDIDGPMGRARKLLGVPESGPPSVLVPNLLDAQDSVRGAMGDGELVLVVGPSSKPNVEGLVREFARILTEPSVAKKANGWAGGAALLREAQLLGANEQSVAEYAVSLVTRSLALRAMDASDPAYEAAAKKGYFGLKEISRYFEGNKPIDGWLLEALAKAETRRPTPK